VRRPRARGTAAAALLLALAACSLRPAPQPATGTRIDLSRANYRVVRSNLTGTSYGFSLFGFIPIVAPTYSAAMSGLYERANGLEEGKAQALVNVVQERSQLYLLLFSIPKLTVRADVIEFNPG
jgi:uncharacterized protein DUF6567